MTATRALLFAVLLTALGGCDLSNKHFDAKFGDQHFKTAISLIEMQKLRYGSYPETLSDLKFLGDWDKIAIKSVEYKRLENGYGLNLVRGFTNVPALTYPDEFWKGLGLLKSNVKSNT